MRHIFSPSFVSNSRAVLLACLTGHLLVLSAATRPHYGGTLRVEIRESIEAADPPNIGYAIGQLNRHFNIAQWVSGSRAAFTADPNAPGGRPFLDNVEIQMGRSFREQAIDLELGKADIVEVDSSQPRHDAGRRLWTSSPVRVLVLLFAPRIDNPRVREALALSVDRSAIHTVLLQRQGEISGALLPQWLSGYAFLFPASQDAARARALLAGLPAAARTLSLAVNDPSNRRIADRIALDARDIGLTLVPSSGRPGPDVRLLEVRIASTDPSLALGAVAAVLALPEPPRAETPEALYAAERSLLEGFRVIPLFQLPDVYGVSPRVRGGPGISPLGEWRFQDLWLEPAQP